MNKYKNGLEKEFSNLLISISNNLDFLTLKHNNIIEFKDNHYTFYEFGTFSEVFLEDKLNDIQNKSYKKLQNLYFITSNLFINYLIKYYKFNINKLEFPMLEFCLFKDKKSHKFKRKGFNILLLEGNINGNNYFYNFKKLKYNSSNEKELCYNKNNNEIEIRLICNVKNNM